MSFLNAIVHWNSKIGAVVVEFFFASSPLEDQKARVKIDIQELGTIVPLTSTCEQATYNGPNFPKRVTALWLSEFDDCSNITMDSYGGCHSR